MHNQVKEELKELLRVILYQPYYENKINHVRALQAVIIEKERAEK